MNEVEIRALVGEVLVAGFDGFEINEHAHRLIVRHQVRNIILFSRNVRSMSQVKDLTAKLQFLARAGGYTLPLLICTDQENGAVRRIAPDLAGLPGNMALGATGDTELAREVGVATAHQLRSVGINMNLAPALDINNNPHNPVIGVRSFGEDPTQVAQFGTAMIQGLQENGIIACGKHFPGHGDTAVDSHLNLPVIPHTRDRLEAVEFVPFKAAIEAGVDVLMTAHVVFPEFNVDGTPATLSRRVLTGLLREELGFQGAITTDCLEMDAILETFGVGEGAVQALLAGADMIMVSHRLDRQEAAIEALVEGVLSRRIPLVRLEEAAKRVRRLRTDRALARALQSVTMDGVKHEAEALQKRITTRAVTIVSDTRGLLPIDLKQVKSIALVMDARQPHMIAAGPMNLHGLVLDTLRCALPNVTVDLFLHDESQSEHTFDIPSAVAGASLIVMGLTGGTSESYRKLVTLLVSTYSNTVVLALQAPYELSEVPRATAIAIYEPTPWMIQAGVEAMLGHGGTGRLPVNILPLDRES